MSLPNEDHFQTYQRTAFKRNIGLLSEQEQARLSEACIAVAGAGGVGGLHLLTCARMGIRKFKIADYDTFDVVNINRQFGAMASTFGKNKAEVMADMLKEINPYAEVEVFKEGVNPDNVEQFLRGSDLFIDGIDFFEIKIRRLLFQTSRAMGIYALTSAPLGFGATLQVFSPKGMSFDDYFGIKAGMSEKEQLAAFAVGLAPHPYHIKYLDMSRVSIEQRTGPALSLACTLCASLVATEVIKILIGKGKVRPVPHYLQVDLLRNKYKRGYLLFGGSNPLQKLKRWIVLKRVEKKVHE